MKVRWWRWATLVAGLAMLLAAQWSHLLMPAWADWSLFAAGFLLTALAIFLPLASGEIWK